MKRRILGAAGISVSEFALGAMKFGDFGSSGNADHANVVDIIHAALDSGINFIDTAETRPRLPACYR
ncbi:aldo/keto reductase [Streptomyces sp. NPDC057460]|uniref:aldo/keto reductase n=1 Tax=Streptomyces sp. NPDC057460 TaxID=3346141 RepID=UPI0036856840